MVESDIAQTRALVGGDEKENHLYYELKRSIAKAQSIDILVSFLMESGIKMILADLKEAIDRGVRVRILTGNYLGITQPSALYLIRNQVGSKIDLRFYNESNRSFHPKAYIFHYAQDKEIYVGSSNISKSALTSGIEWNYRFSQSKDPVCFNFFYDTFFDLYENHSILIDDEVLASYSKNWNDIIKQQRSRKMLLFMNQGAHRSKLCML